MAEILIYMATGAFAGIASGLLGVGGGLIIVPILYFVFTAQGQAVEHVMHMALATSLATIIITSISSVIAHQQKQAVLWPIILKITPGICIGAWLGGLLASQLSTSVLKPAFGVFELFVAIYMLSNYKPAAHRTTLGWGKFSSGGFFIGAISALTGIGGGTMTVPFLSWHNISIRKAVATSAACGLPIAVIATAAYVYSGWSANNLPSASLGYVHLDAFAFIVIVSVLTAPIGAMLAHRVPEKSLKKIFAVFILLVSLKMIAG
jgi:uncharacterized membrane protein YfcA